MEQRSAIAPCRQQLQPGIGQHLCIQRFIAACLDDNQCRIGQRTNGAQLPDRGKAVAAAIGRISHHQGCCIPLPACNLQRISRQHAAVCRAFQPRYILTQGGKCLLIGFNKAGKAGPAAQCLQPQRAGAGKGINHNSIGNDLAKPSACEDIEQGFAGAISCWSGSGARGKGQLCAAMAAGDDSHPCLVRLVCLMGRHADPDDRACRRAPLAPVLRR